MKLDDIAGELFEAEQARSTRRALLVGGALLTLIELAYALVALRTPGGQTLAWCAPVTRRSARWRPPGWCRAAGSPCGRGSSSCSR
jgi:hypothetical protein